jgi:hypothetical protein
MWKPIATAPRDGTKLLLCRARDADQKPMSKDAWGVFVQVGAWWDTDEWVVYCDMSNEPRLHFEPSHWDWLPPAPETWSHAAWRAADTI